MLKWARLVQMFDPSLFCVEFLSDSFSCTLFTRLYGASSSSILSLLSIVLKGWSSLPPNLFICTRLLELNEVKCCFWSPQPWVFKLFRDCLSCCSFLRWLRVYYYSSPFASSIKSCKHTSLESRCIFSFNIDPLCLSEASFNCKSWFSRDRLGSFANCIDAASLIFLILCYSATKLLY